MSNRKRLQELERQMGEVRPLIARLVSNTSPACHCGHARSYHGSIAFWDGDLSLTNTFHCWRDDCRCRAYSPPTDGTCA